MTDDDLDRLLADTPSPTLHSLEAAIWRRVDRRATEDRRLAEVGAWQGGALLVAAVASLTVGVLSASAAVQPHALSVFSPNLASAPSTRLIGPSS